MTGFVERVLEDGRRYVVYVPYDVAPPSPTILFLHGRGESGTDGLRPLIHGPAQAILRNRELWPFLLVFAQKPEQDALWPTELAYLHQVCHEVDDEFYIDHERLYLTGLSQGGHGTLALADQLPWRFAACAAVCAWCDDLLGVANRFTGLPLRLYHGSADDVIPISRSAEIAEAVEGAEFIRYDEVGHDSWVRAYQDSDLPAWLLSHRREI